MAIDPSNFKPLSADSLASKSNEDVSQSSKLLPTHRRADLVAPKAATLSTPEKTLDPVTSAATPITVPALNNSEAVGHSADARAGNSKPLSGHDQELMRRQVENEILKQNLQSNSAGSLWPAYTLFTSTVLLLAAWLIGPRLVEEYNFAATRGKVRAEYESAVHLLEEQPLEKVSKAFQLVAHKVRPSVVSINAVKEISGGSPGSHLTGFGSGVIMSSEGYIITNAHVLEDASSCQVQLHDRSRYTAKLVGIDLFSDLAVLKIDAHSLVPAKWGDSDEASVGSIVWAIGSPYRYEQTVTSGILSGKDRPGDKTRKQNLLQTDAAVNPGNSGGPLVDANGDVIGINTSIYGESFQGISFAVPSSTAQFVYRQLIEKGKVIRGYLGVHPREVSHRLAANWALPDLDGALLEGVMSNSPADLAGIRGGDVIRSWNGKAIRRYNTLYQLAEMAEPNSSVEVVLIRNGQEMQKEVVVGELPQSNRVSRSIQRPTLTVPENPMPQIPVPRNQPNRARRDGAIR
jgi:S1-C subfamily serine protease